MRFERLALALLAVAAIALAAIPPTFAAFSSQADSTGNLVSAVPDFRAPQVTALALGKTLGGATGFVKGGSTYYAYANVAADTGNPASGIASVSADVSGFTTGSTAVPLTAGSFSAGGIAYGYRSAALTANVTPSVESARAFSIATTDNATNVATFGGSATVDNTAPLGADVQTANGGGSNGLPDQGDTITLTFSEPVEPQPILAGWNGAAANVVVRIVDNGLIGLPLGNDTAQIYDSANATLLPLGSVDLGRSDFVSGALGGNIRFGVTGTPSTMTISGNAVTIVLGTYANPGFLEATRGTAAAAGTMVWTPTATPYDRAGNAAATTAASETGAADRDF